jgi:DEAD/DEAH box helicase domain-containing protein
MCAEQHPGSASGEGPAQGRTRRRPAGSGRSKKAAAAKGAPKGGARDRGPARLLEKLEGLAYRNESLVRVEEIPRRRAAYAALSRPLPEPIAQALRSRGIEKLYVHQAEAVEAARAGENIVVVTGTASGKTLCYLVPVLESLMAAPGATALMLFPTKALAQDQLKGIAALSESAGGALDFTAGTYDGDTPPRLRSKLRDEAAVILTNPDMLHAGILPNHAKWARFFSQLQYVVCDEIHVYRGIFGSNVANVMRRLRRICRHYGAEPRFICSSATIANPGELAEGLTGMRFRRIDRDGSPRGRKHFALWNPPVLSHTSMDRRSSNLDARDLLLSFIRDGYQGITFVRARQVAEVLLRYCQEELGRHGGGLAARLRAYRGGYLPEERRAIERALFGGELLGVISTNALELGIDVGSLDVALIVGYPGTIASTWQQAGRAGRTNADALAVLIAHNTPIDQYLMRHPEYFFSQSPENAVIDPNNPHILLGHLRAAAYEMPIGARDEELFGEYAPAILEILEEHGEVRFVRGRWYYATDGYPAAETGLRNAGDEVFVIVDTGTPGAPVFERSTRSGDPFDGPTTGRHLPPPEQRASVRRAIERGYRIIGTLDQAGAYAQLHPQAIYLHDAETYFVEHLDLTERVAYVHKVNLEYYTQSIADSRIRIVETEKETLWRRSEIGFGSLAVSEKVYLFKKVRFGSRESVGFGPVDLPVQTLETEGLWVTPPAAALAEVARHGRIAAEGLWGIANVLRDVITIHAMCDVMDIGTAMDARGTGAPSLFVYDKYPGGLGFARKSFHLCETLMQGALDLITGCPCEAGCPSCVGAPMLPHSTNDPDAGGRGRIPDKEAALVLLHHMLEKEPYIPKGPRPNWEGPATAGDGLAGGGSGDGAAEGAVASGRGRAGGAGGAGDEDEPDADEILRRRREVKPLPPEVARRLRRSLGLGGESAEA